MILVCWSPWDSPHLIMYIDKREFSAKPKNWRFFVWQYFSAKICSESKPQNRNENPYRIFYTYETSFTGTPAGKHFSIFSKLLAQLTLKLCNSFNEMCWTKENNIYAKNCVCICVWNNLKKEKKPNLRQKFISIKNSHSYRR